MLHEFTLSRGKAMINFTLKYCDTKEKLLSSYGFRRVVEAFITKIKKDDPIVYDYYIESFKTDESLIESLIESFKLLTVF
ncbi:phosphoenolpyruvate carboxykinase, partial [Dysgonomonas sp. OttesenSCG-928-M03]|nr:phosphoenolpyruvate carboxykinase [Dysgonomonas sp. OttesenSCG-928-M03]